MMKKFLCVLLCLAIPVCAYADIFDDFAEKANSAAEAIGGLAENAGDWLKSAEDTVSGLWDTAAGKMEEAWNWSLKVTGEKLEEAQSLLQDVSGWIGEKTEMSVSAVEAAYVSALELCGIAKDAAVETWAFVETYAAEHDIDPATLGKLSLVIFLYRFCAGADVDLTDAVAITRLLSVWFKDFGVLNETAAEEALTAAGSALDTFLNR